MGAGGMDSFGGEEELDGRDELDEADILDEANNALTILGSTSPRAAPAFVGGFASHHPGGANFAMGDGSIRYFASTMTEIIYRKLGHRADGELVDLE